MEKYELKNIDYIRALGKCCSNIDNVKLFCVYGNFCHQPLRINFFSLSKLMFSYMIHRSSKAACFKQTPVDTLHWALTMGFILCLLCNLIIFLNFAILTILMEEAGIDNGCWQTLLKRDTTNNS